MIGLSGLVLQLFTSYLTHSIIIDKSYSPLSPLKPRYFPSLFSIYIRSIADLINNYLNIHYHICDDDILLFNFFLINSHNTINSELIKYANCIRLWLLSNKLLINAYKTTLLNKYYSDTYFLKFSLINMIIYPSHSSINPGLVFDDKLLFKNHISSITNYQTFISSELKKYRPLFPEFL